MTGAVNAIEKIKKGLSDHPQVKAVLKKQNESDELEEAAVKVIPEKLPRMNRDEKDIADTLTKAGLVYGKVNKFDSGKFIDPKTGVSITIMRNGNAVAASSADGGTLLSPTDPSNLKAFLKKRGLIESPAIEEAMSPADKAKRLKMIRLAVEKIMQPLSIAPGSCLDCGSTDQQLATSRCHFPTETCERAPSSKPTQPAR